MAGTLPVKAVGKETKCGICLESLREPKLLPCLHSFCRECLQTYLQSQTETDSFPCPLCRETIATPDNMADGLADNIYILTSLTEAVKAAAPNCEMCEDQEASTMCLECKQDYCTHCAKMHTKQTYTKEHHLVTCDQDRKDERRIQSKVYCNKHPSQELGCYCVECQEVICFKCNMIAHKHHHSKDIEEVAAEKRREVLSVIENDIEGQAVPDIRSYTNALQTQRSEYESNKAEQRRLIEGRVTRIKERLDEKATRMISAMEEDLNSRSALLERAINTLESMLEASAESRYSARRMMEAAGDCEWLQRYKAIKERLEQQLKSKREIFETAEYVYSSPATNSDDTIVQHIGSLNVIVGSTPPMNVELIQTIDIETGYHEAICAGSDDTVWAGGKTQVKLYKKDRGEMETIEMGDTVHDIAKDDTGQIFVACKRSVKTISEDRQPETLFPLQKQPSGLACSPVGDIVVGFESAREIIQYSREGAVVKQFSTVHDGSKPVKPYRLTFSGNADLVVSDRGSNSVVVFDVAGQLKAVITGDGVRPTGLACSDRGHLFVADYNRNRVMMCPLEGRVLQTLVPSRDNGLYAPFGLSLDASGRHLWVGHLSGKVKLYRTSSV